MKTVDWSAVGLIDLGPYMKNSIAIYLKHQKAYQLFLLVIFVVPLALFLQFSTYVLPKVQYVVLGALFASQYIFYREKDFHKKIEKDVTSALKKELGRVPSQKEIHARSVRITYHRGVSIVITALCILALMLYFQEF
tara:strand:+ start:32129 stop:32539 length:411 start_codon:yes stop_codon:yes gene_type:complete